jgi:DNA end-binding protein Ku
MHSVWRGALSFGLVNIPVRLYHASRPHELKFHLLHKKDLSQIRYARICKSEEKEVPWEDIVKGFEIKEGEYVVFTEEDFEKINPKKSKTLEILNFTEENEIDPIYFTEPYCLLREALKKSQKVGIGTFVFRNHEHIGMIKPSGDLLLLVELRYHDDMLGVKDLNVPKQKAIAKNELDVALQFIHQMTQPFDPKDYADTYSKDVQRLLKQKEKGKKVKVKKEPAASKSPKIHDIMSLLKKSLKESPKKTRRSA